MPCRARCSNREPREDRPERLARSCFRRCGARSLSRDTALLGSVGLGCAGMHGARVDEPAEFAVIRARARGAIMASAAVLVVLRRKSVPIALGGLERTERMHELARLATVGGGLSLQSEEHGQGGGAGVGERVMELRLGSHGGSFLSFKMAIDTWRTELERCSSRAVSGTIRDRTCAVPYRLAASTHKSASISEPHFRQRFLAVSNGHLQVGRR